MAILEKVMDQCRVNTVSEILACQMGDSPPILIADPIVGSGTNWWTSRMCECKGCMLDKSLLSAWQNCIFKSDFYHEFLIFIDSQKFELKFILIQFFTTVHTKWNKTQILLYQQPVLLFLASDLGSLPALTQRWTVFRW